MVGKRASGPSGPISGPVKTCRVNHPGTCTGTSRNNGESKERTIPNHQQSAWKKWWKRIASLSSFIIIYLGFFFLKPSCANSSQAWWSWILHSYDLWKNLWAEHSCFACRSSVARSLTWKLARATGLQISYQNSVAVCLTISHNQPYSDGPLHGQLEACTAAILTKTETVNANDKQC